MNVFKKYCPNVWVAECDDTYEKGEIIQLETKYGNDVDCEVYNFLFNKNGKNYYSIVRIEDKSYAERKAERYRNAACNKTEKSNAYYEAANEGRDFLVLGQPIQVGHHSEAKHRALIERNRNRMDKSMELQESAEKSESKAEYWERKAEEINLAMPESLEYFKHKLEKAVDYHSKVKSGEVPQEHSFTLAYAKKAVNDLKEKVEIATKLWA